MINAQSASNTVAIHSRSQRAPDDALSSFGFGEKGLGLLLGLTTVPGQNEHQSATNGETKPKTVPLTH